MTAKELVERYPEIAWYEPALISHPDGVFYGCRICIALVGYKGDDMTEVPTTPDEWIEHMAVKHGA